jgi:regulator of protease activity HflC (stomatin/prohibitin superfamily)
MFGYRVPAPDEAMLISGGKSAGGAPFRVVTGHGAFVPPFYRKVAYLTLAMQEAEVAEQCVTKQGIALKVQAVIAFKVGNDEESTVNAGQRFLSDQSQMPVLTGRIFAGHLRSIVGSMTVEEIITERQKLATEVLDGSKIEMSKIGLIVDSLQIQSIDDMGAGYIAAMAAPNNAAIQRQAKIAQAQADQAAAEAQQASARAQAEFGRQTSVAQAQFGRETSVAQAQARAELAVAEAAAQQTQAEAEQTSARKQAEFARETSVVQAQYKAEVDKAQAEAAQAGPLAAATAQNQVIGAQAGLARKQADLREQQLVAEVVRPAQAEAQRVTILAKAEADKLRLLAEAAVAGDRVSLDQKVIDQLPQIVAAAAGGLSGAHLTVLSGSDGLGEMLAGIVSQGISLLGTVRSALPAPVPGPDADADAGLSAAAARDGSGNRRSTAGV